ncbi:MAG: histidine phosphatase family protein [Clostridiales bacterium]|nr:histidine phosphatase family protein [Clostridiales bacterium]
MTRVYFVRHAQPDHEWKDDRTRPLTAEGVADSWKVAEFFKKVNIDFFYSSPYIRSVNTIKGSADCAGKEIRFDERLRERKGGASGKDSYPVLQKRWDDFNFCEEGGENLSSVQRRNIEALKEILERHADKSIVVGTHGTALSVILNFYSNSFSCEDFLNILYYFPYIIRLDFDKQRFLGLEELMAIEKQIGVKDGYRMPNCKS